MQPLPSKVTIIFSKNDQDPNKEVSRKKSHPLIEKIVTNFFLLRFW